MAPTVVVAPAVPVVPTRPVWRVSASVYPTVPVKNVAPMAAEVPVESV